MGILEEKGLEPGKVFHFFEELCGIPHGSGNVRMISDYLADFARARSLDFTQDDAKNIVIRKKASYGYEYRDTVVLQGHMDMVAVKNEGVSLDLTKDGLDLRTDGTEIWAEGTSLGGDDGIAVAYCLALLDSVDIPHPPLEGVITTDEETGMCGAKALDPSLVRGRRLINIDNEEEGVLLVSCAGGARFNATLPVKRVSPRSGAKRYVLAVEGLSGGHSGEMIIKGGANACVILGRLLRELSDVQGATVELISLSGGEADNAIARSARADLFVSGNTEGLIELFGRLSDDIRTEYRKKDPDMRISLIQVDETQGDGPFASQSPLDPSSFRSLARYITVMPNGVQSMSADIDGLVETSLNLGLLSMGEKDTSVSLGYSVRSSVRSAREELLSKLSILTERFNGAYSITGSYPEWPYRQYSPLRDTMVRVHEELFGQTPQIKAIHAGVECGIFSEKLETLDCVSIGPDMKGIHTTGERLSVSSCERMWNYLRAVLAAL